MGKNNNKISIGVSSCLLGNKVRYDGNHQYNTFIANELRQKFQLINFCPEMEIGLGVPREKIQLMEKKGKIICVDEKTSLIDYTQKLSNCCQSQMVWLKTVSGYIFKTKSPSCGVTKVKTDFQGTIKSIGKGIFAKKLIELFPYLPVIEEDQLNDLELRNFFIYSVVNYNKNDVLHMNRINS